MRANSHKADFEVRWYPFQLNPHAPEVGQNKVEMYMRKFGMTRQQTFDRMGGMSAAFAEVGLPFKFTDAGKTGNTWNGHRLLSFAFHKGGAKMQDVIAEELFLNYFGEEKFINDPDVLSAAARKGGLNEDDIKNLVEDPEFFSKETMEEMAYGKTLQVSGVPHFVLSNGRIKKVVRGAQDAEVFAQVIASML